MWLHTLCKPHKNRSKINALVGVEFLEIRDIALSYHSCGAYCTNFFTSVSYMNSKRKEVRYFSEAKHGTILTSWWFFRLSNEFQKKRFLIAFHHSISAKISPVTKRDISLIYVFYPPGGALLEFLILKRQSKAFISYKWLQGLTIPSSSSSEQRKLRNRFHQITKSRFVIHLFTNVG